MAPFPVSTQVEDDFIVNVVFVDTEDTMDQVATAAAGVAIGLRLRPKPGTLRVRPAGSADVLPRDLKVHEAEWQPLEALEVVYE